MAARFVVLAVCACAAASRASQPAATIYLDLSHQKNLEVEKRYTPQLLRDLQEARDSALLLYMEYASEAAADVKAFIKNITGLTRDTIDEMETRVLDRASRVCRDQFDEVVQKAQNDAHRAALFSGENHHKYLLGQMIVIRMHLNKSEDYIRRCEKIYRDCGVPCEVCSVKENSLKKPALEQRGSKLFPFLERRSVSSSGTLYMTTPRMVRWRRLALMEINRVKEDIVHTRKTYKDLIIHNRRKLNHLKKEAHVRAGRAVEVVEACVKNTSC